MSVKLTFYFSDVFPSFEDFKEYVDSLPILSKEDNFTSFIYNVISYQYPTSNIRYNEKEAFKASLGNVLINKYDKYKREKELIDSIYKLTLEEITIVNEALNNQAENPNTSPTKPLEPLTYVSSQTFSRITNNKLISYLEALNNVPTLNVYTFLRGESDALKLETQINDLFMVVVPRNNYIYKEEK